jgi:molecular chaperone GrpE
MMHKNEEQKKEEAAGLPNGSQSAEPKPQQTAEPKHPHLKDEQLKELQEKLASALKEKDELFGRLQRLSADYANFQKRSARQTAETVCFEREKIIKSLLPAIDDFEHTINNAAAAPQNPDAVIRGIKIVYDHILDILKSHDVEQIKTVGEKFDPLLHEAIMQMTQPGKEDNIVLEETRRGYKHNGRIIRPGKVIVNKLQAQPVAEKTEPPKPETRKEQQEETTDTE